MSRVGRRRQCLSHLLRCSAATLILPAGCALTGRSAACLRGLPLGEPDDPVHVVVGPGSRFRAKGFRISRATLPDNEVILGTRSVTTPGRTAWEIASEPDLVEAVAALDVLLGHGYVRAESLAALAAAHPRARGARAIGLADGRAESPQESRARVRLILAGLPAPVPQYVVRANGVFVARLDLAWCEAKVACEYDGAGHANARQMRADRVRLNKLVAAGWTVLHLTTADLADPERFARFMVQLCGALGRG